MLTLFTSSLCHCKWCVNWGFVILQRLGGLSYFAGAEKKDERVLVPDLGSLTSVHDRLSDIVSTFCYDTSSQGEEY